MAIEHSRPIKKSARKPTLVDRVYEFLHYRQFHWIAINASRKEYLSQMLTHVWNLMHPHPFAKIRRFVRRVRVDRGCHVQLVEALEAGNGRKAREVLIDRIAHAKETLAELVTSWEVVGVG